LLGKLCGFIASDEQRHAKAYKLFFKRIVELDPEGAVLAFRDMMKSRITMPASLMDHEEDPGLFSRYALVAERIGVYTAKDYADILQHLVQYWNIEGIPGLSGEAAQAQEYLCGLATRYYRLADRLKEKARPDVGLTFRWIFDRSV